MKKKMADYYEDKNNSLQNLCNKNEAQNLTTKEQHIDDVIKTV